MSKRLVILVFLLGLATVVTVTVQLQTTERAFIGGFLCSGVPCLALGWLIGVVWQRGRKLAKPAGRSPRFDDPRPARPIVVVEPGPGGPKLEWPRSTRWAGEPSAPPARPFEVIGRDYTEPTET